MMADSESIKAPRNGPEYLAWINMRRRCYDTKYTSHPYYGARGITVCERWKDFACFFADMGVRPSPAHSLDRIDTNGHYSPDNCRWSTKDVQQQTRRYCRLTPEKVAEVWRLHRLGQKPKAIAQAVGCTSHNVQGVIKGRTWRQFRLDA
jgi:hypothetical protein